MTADTSYYYVKGARVALEREPNVYAVRLKAAVKDDSPSISPSGRRLLREESQPIAFIANYGLRVLRSVATQEAGEAVRKIDRLDAEAGVDQAAVAYRRTPGSDDLMFATRRFIVQFRADVDRNRIDAFNQQHGVRIVEPTAYMANGYLLEAPSGEGATGPVALANTYFESGLALSATPDFVRMMHTKSTPTRERSTVLDERAPRAQVSARGGQYLDRQWHLGTANVLSAWNVTTGDPSIVVAVLDDGVDVDHVEFAGKVVGQSDFAGQVSDARPKTSTDNHGTACAGVAVALGANAHGSAPGASLLAVRTPEYLGIADEAEMFRWVCDQGADVISCSWGPADGTGATDPLPDSTREAIRYCVAEGRGGKGIPIVWAAGNGDESVSLDGYASNPDVMAIGASTDRETRAWYSDHGPEVWVCAPSSGSSAAGERRIFTTDRAGSAGYNTGSASAGDQAGDYTNDFGGTSSATPLVAGIIALMLSVDPSLTHKDVKGILRSTAAKIGDAASYNSSGHSDEYGFGRVDARAAVDAAGGGGSTSTPTPAGRPTISGPSEVSRSDWAPSFTVDTGANPLWAVEVATGWQLFDGSHDADRTADTFFASWEASPLLEGSSYDLPDDAWQRLRAADRLYYRVHSATDSSWTDWQVSTPDDEAADAPWIEVTAGAIAEEERSRTDRPTVTGPASAQRGGAAPTFRVDTAGKPLYALELAARPELFDAADAADRTSATHWGSWEDLPLLTAPEFELPAAVWNRLQSADRLSYRVHVAEDEQWTGWDVSTPDASAAAAPTLTVTSSPAWPAGPRRVVAYPSATFDEALAPDDGVDYSDPVANGVVPLIEVRDRLDDRLSANFLVRELAARRVDARGEFAAYARISPQLVAGLQAMRAELGVAVSVNSCYRYPALNEDVDGAGQSQHQAGRAADIRAAGVTPLELAACALRNLGTGIGLGLGRNSLHVDVRGQTTSWVYEGAALSEAEFDAWVRTNAASRSRSERVRSEGLERGRPSITGPTTASAGGPPPTFSIDPGAAPYFGVEVTSDWRTFADPPVASEIGFASWTGGGLQESGLAHTTAYTIPAAEWHALATVDRLYYRVLAGGTARAADALPSVPPDRAEDAPSLQVTGGRAGKSAPAVTVDPAAVRREDDARWRSAPTTRS